MSETKMPANEAVDWSRFVPTGALPRSPAKVHGHIQAGDVFASWASSEPGGSVRTDGGSTILSGCRTWDSGCWRLIRHADGTWAPGYDANGPTDAKAKPAERQLAPGWVRLETPGRHDDGRMWFCICPGTARATYANGMAGACEACAERAGVFGPVAIGVPPSRAPAAPSQFPVTPNPMEKSADPLARKSCPACSDVPFDARRCPRCGLASKAEPVRVRLAPVGTCTGPLDTHGVAVLRVGRHMGRDCEVDTFHMCDGCWLFNERYCASEMRKMDEPFFASNGQPPARVGTVPQSLGSGAGIGIWASRGMR